LKMHDRPMYPEVQHPGGDNCPNRRERIADDAGHG